MRSTSATTLFAQRIMPRKAVRSPEYFLSRGLESSVGEAGCGGEKVVARRSLAEMEERDEGEEEVVGEGGEEPGDESLEPSRRGST